MSSESTLPITPHMRSIIVDALRSEIVRLEGVIAHLESGVGAILGAETGEVYIRMTTPAQEKPPKPDSGSQKLDKPTKPPVERIDETKKPAKKRGRPKKVRHAVCQADIVKVLEKTKTPLTVFGITEFLETELSITVTEKRVKAVLESGEGSKFFPTDDGRWGLAL